MNQHTCAACDCDLDENAVQVKLGGRIVEACCDACANQLRVAYAAAASAQPATRGSAA